MSVPKAVPRVLLAVLGILALALSAQSAKADTIDFACGGAFACTGTVIESGPYYSSMGIGVTASYSPDPFTLVFDTSNNSISIVDTIGTDQFIGTIVGLVVTPGMVDDISVITLDFGVDWTTVAPSTGTWGVTVPPSGSVVSISIDGGALDASSVDVPVITPEPAVPAMLSAGMLAIALFRKRKAGVLA